MALKIEQETKEMKISDFMKLILLYRDQKQTNK